jgi:hypothetical protein
MSRADLSRRPARRQAFGNQELSNLLLSFMNPEEVLHVLSDMRGICSLALAFVAFAAAPAWAFRLQDPNTPPLTEHQRELRLADRQSQPYAMNLADEAARSMGVQDGKWEAFSTQPRDPMMPAFRGGIDQGRAMIGLQWRR